VQVVGLLQDVVEDTPRSVQDVRDGFGETIAAVQALTEDDSIHNYAQRRHALRAQVIGAGTTVICPANGPAPAAPRFVTEAATRVQRGGAGRSVPVS
jgi:hypothetical protein